MIRIQIKSAITAILRFELLKTCIRLFLPNRLIVAYHEWTRCKPVIMVQHFRPKNQKFFVEKPSFRQLPGACIRSGVSVSEFPKLTSELCLHERLSSKTFQDWIKALKLPALNHRKQWELAYILQALDERQMIGPGKKGLGFAVGTERTPALLASLGCDILATDLDGADARIEDWQPSRQWAGSLEEFYEPDICSREKFDQHVRYRPVDMNHIPKDLVDFDFTWSTCSFEHCGSLELGIEFIENQMSCLKPRGIAVHTTEFNLTSNIETWEKGTTAIFRLRDIEEIVKRLTAQGHHVEPINLEVGTHELDRHVDHPRHEAPHYDKTKHLRLALGDYACTSIGLIVEKRA